MKILHRSTFRPRYFYVRLSLKFIGTKVVLMSAVQEWRHHHVVLRFSVVLLAPIDSVYAFYDEYYIFLLFKYLHVFYWHALTRGSWPLCRGCWRGLRWGSGPRSRPAAPRCSSGRPAAPRPPLSQGHRDSVYYCLRSRPINPNVVSELVSQFYKC